MDMRQRLGDYLAQIVPTPSEGLSVSLYRLYGVRDIEGCADWYCETDSLERRGMAKLPENQTHTLDTAKELVEELVDVITDLFLDGHEATLVVIRDSEVEQATLIRNIVFQQVTVRDGLKRLLDGDTR